MDTLFRLDRALVVVSGPDAHSFLENLLTQNLRGLGQGRSVYAALLTPQGKVLADMILRPYGQDILIELDRAREENLLRRLNMYKLRSAVSLEPVPPGMEFGWSMESFDTALQDPRLPELGWRGFFAARASPPDGAAQYQAHRVALGVPDLTQDAAAEEVFALEALLEELNGVDFQKGCFVGQENVSRMKRRATTRKKFCPVVFDGEPPPYGTPIRAGEAELGSIRSGGAGRAIALLRLDRAIEATDKGQQLTAGEKSVRLDPPAWLLLPARDD